MGLSKLRGFPANCPRETGDSPGFFSTKSSLHNFFQALTPDTPVPMMCRCGIVSRHEFRLTTEQDQGRVPKTHSTRSVQVFGTFRRNVLLRPPVAPASFGFFFNGVTPWFS